MPAEKLENCRICIWTTHGIYGTGKDLDEAFGLVETVEKAAELYMLTAGQNRKNEIKDSELRDLAAVFGFDYRKDYLD